MSIVIVGAGKTGFSLAQKLLVEDKQVVIIERNREKALFADNNLDCQVIMDQANSIEVLRLAKVQRADFFIALTESDEMNMILCALVSSEFRGPKTIARVRNIDYSNSSILSGKYLGIDCVINPETELAKNLIQIVEQGARSEVMTFEGGRYQIRDFAIGKVSFFKDRQVQDLRNEISDSFLIVSIFRDNDYIIPNGQTIILENDHIYILSTDAGFEHFFSLEGNKHKDIKKILLVGGGKTGIHFADYIYHQNMPQGFDLPKKGLSFRRKKRSLHIVEEDYDQCKLLAERFPDAIVTHSDISDEGFLEEENLSGFDLMVNLTGSSELNIIAGVYGKSRGINRILAVVKKDNYRRICRTLQVDVTISKKSSVVSSIIKIVRSGDVRTVYPFPDSDLEAIELVVQDSSKMVGSSIKDIKMPKGILILFISRKGDSFIPSGDIVIESGDSVAFLSGKNAIHKLEKLVQ